MYLGFKLGGARPNSLELSHRVNVSVMQRTGRDKLGIGPAFRANPKSALPAFLTCNLGAGKRRCGLKRRAEVTRRARAHRGAGGTIVAVTSSFALLELEC